MKPVPAYRHGMTVPSVEMTMTLRVPAGVNHAAVEDLLTRLLEVPLSELPPRPTVMTSDEHAAVDAADASAAAYVAWVLSAQAALMRIGFFPVFQPGIVLSLNTTRAPENKPTGAQEKANGDHLALKLALPFVDAVPLAALRKSLLAAEQLVGAAVCAPQRVDDAWVDLTVRAAVVGPLRALAAAGVSTLPILRAAADRRVPLRHLGNGIYQLGHGARGRLMSRSALDADAALGLEVSTRKDHCAQLLGAAGIPVPVHRLVSTIDVAVAAATELGYPLVVKPADRERSEGVVTRIADEQALRQAFESARKLSRNVLVERQIPGTCYRLLVADGQFLYSVERGARAVEGDGQRSVVELIERDRVAQEATPSWRRTKVVPLDDETFTALSLQGWSLDSVPPSGTSVRLRIIESTEWSETTVDVTDRVHPANVAVAEQAARVLGLRNAGIDLITTDISRPWWEVASVVTEVNFRPHFGGTQAARSRMGIFLNRILKSGGRIPIAVFLGGERAAEAARARQQIWAARGLLGFVADTAGVVAPEGPMHLACAEPGLWGICRALLLNRRVEALAVVVRDDEFLRTGLPLDRITRLEVLASPSPVVDALVALMQPYMVAAASDASKNG